VSDTSERNAVGGEDRRERPVADGSVEARAPVQSRRVVIVDDDEVFAGVLSRGLARHGFDTALAASCEAALDAARDAPPSHVVLDLKLGDQSGLELIAPLLAMRSDMKILVLTGFASIATAVSAIKLGATNYLAKPVDLHSVLEVLTSAGSTALPVAADFTRPSPRRLEWEYIQRVLAQHGGNVSATARALNMHRRTLQRKLAKRPVSD
jgi:two-component system response regulator RegA